jgi:isopenicillin-N epimerase
MDPAYWTRARATMMLELSSTNLNTGSFGPLSRCVFDRVTLLRQRLAEEPMDFIVRQLPPLLWEARERLAHFIHGDPRRLVYTVNVTAAINLVAASLAIPAPGEILLTDHEYGAMHWCWERAAQRQGLTLRTFPLPTRSEEPAAIIEAAVAAMSPRTRLFFFSHVLSPTGLVLPARELCAEARRRGIVTVVDGAHALAMIPLDVEAVGADYYGSNCHKWLLAPTGTGFLYARPDALERIAPLQVSWGWQVLDRSRQDERDEFGSTWRLRHLEFEGTRDVCPWLAVPTAIDYQQQLGVDAIRRRIAELVRHTRGVIKLPLETPSNPVLHGAMTAFRLPTGIDPVMLRRQLWERYRIEAPIIEKPDRTMIRVSTHFYTTEREVDRLAEALRELVISGN